MVEEPIDLLREPIRRLTGLWWLWLLAGIGWIVVALVVLQFDQASIRTVGVIIGLLFLVSGAQQLGIAVIAPAWRWVWAIFGVLLIAAGIVSLIEPEKTFAGVADILGFLFLIVGLLWTVQAFLERPYNDLWWIGLIAGVLMIILAFWTAGQFFITRAYVLLVFAGIWALMHGVQDIFRAFTLRAVHKQL